MRLRETYDPLNKAVRLVDLQTVGIASTAAMKLVQPDRVRRGLEYLCEVPGFESDVAQLTADVALTAPSAEKPAIDRFVNQASSVVARAESLRDIIGASLPEEDERSLSVRIPPPDDISGLSKTLGKLQVVFEEPAKRLFGADRVAVRFQGFDTGSAWIELAFVVTAAAKGADWLVKFVVALLSAGNTLRKERAEAISAENNAKNSSVAREVVQQLADAQKLVIDARLQDLSSKIVESFKEGASPGAELKEVQNLIGVGIETWASLVDRGASYRLALCAPSDIARNVPDPAAAMDIETFEKTLPALAANIASESARSDEGGEASFDNGDDEEDEVEE